MWIAPQMRLLSCPPNALDPLRMKPARDWQGRCALVSSKFATGPSRPAGYGTGAAGDSVASAVGSEVVCSLVHLSSLFSWTWDP